MRFKPRMVDGSSSGSALLVASSKIVYYQEPRETRATREIREIREKEGRVHEMLLERVRQQFEGRGEGERGEGRGGGRGERGEGRGEGRGERGRGGEGERGRGGEGERGRGGEGERGRGGEGERGRGGITFVPLFMASAPAHGESHELRTHARTDAPHARAGLATTQTTPCSSPQYLTITSSCGSGGCLFAFLYPFVSPTHKLTFLL